MVMVEVEGFLEVEVEVVEVATEAEAMVADDHEAAVDTEEETRKNVTEVVEVDMVLPLLEDEAVVVVVAAAA